MARSTQQEPDEDLAEEVGRLDNLDMEQVLEEARIATLKLLLAKVRRGSISAPEMAVLRNLLRDNGMILGLGDDLAEQPAERAPLIGFHIPNLPQVPEDDE